MTNAVEPRPPFPPFTRESAIEKVRKAEDAWNSRDPARVALAYTPDSLWRNRSQFITAVMRSSPSSLPSGSRTRNACSTGIGLVRDPWIIRICRTSVSDAPPAVDQ